MAEDDATMREYEMSMEEEIKLLVKKVDALDKRFDAVDEQFGAMDKKFTNKFDALDQKFGALDQKFGALENKVDTLDRNSTSKFGQIMLRLDETHAVAKLGLEGLEGLRESMDAKFEAATKNSADQMGLLKSVLVHVRQRVDASDRPGTRRRKS